MPAPTAKRAAPTMAFNLDGLPADPELTRLAKFFDTTVAPGCRASSTLASYQPIWLKFVHWCEARRAKYLPADPRIVALYLADILARATSPATVLQASAAIAFHHWVSGLPTPTLAAQPAMVRATARRTLQAGMRAKSAFPAIAMDCVLSNLRREGSLRSLIRAVAFALAFYAFMRYDELIFLRWDVIRFTPGAVELFIEKSKSDQELHGTWKAVPEAPKDATCPVQLVRTLLNLGAHQATDGRTGGYLIRNVTERLKMGGFTMHATCVKEKHVIQAGKETHPKGTPAPSTINRWLKEAAASQGIDPNTIGSHSLKIGGVTTAVEAGVEDHLIITQAGWKSAEMLNRYDRQTTGPVRTAASAGIMASIVAHRGHVSDTVGTLQLDDIIREFDLSPEDREELMFPPPAPGAGSSRN